MLKLVDATPRPPRIGTPVALPMAFDRDFIVYMEILADESGQKTEPAKLIAPTLEILIGGDRGFAKARGAARRRAPNSASSPPPNAPD